MATKRHRGDKDRGAAAVEFALVVPLLLTLVFGIIEFGWAYGQMLDVRHGAREGARLVSVNALPPGMTSDDVTPAQQSDYIVATVCDRMDLTDDAEVTLSLETAGEASAGALAIVEIDSDLQTITGWFDGFLGTKNLNSTLQVRLEQEATWNEITAKACSSVVPAP